MNDASWHAAGLRGLPGGAVDGADEDLREAAAGNTTLPVDDIRRISSAASGGPS